MITSSLTKLLKEVAQWIRYLTTNQGIPGSNTGGVDYFSYEENPKKIFAKKSNLWDDLEIINQLIDSVNYVWGEKQPINT